MVLGFGIALGFASVGVLCWLLFLCAVYAAPLYVGAMVCLTVYHHGIPGAHAVLLGFGAGIAVLVVGQAILATSREPVIRVVISLLLAIPAALAGFGMTLGFCGMGGMPLVAEYVFAMLGALCVGGSAWIRLCAVPSP